MEYDLRRLGGDNETAWEELQDYVRAGYETVDRVPLK
jgi:hypothetical protein